MTVVIFCLMGGGGGTVGKVDFLRLGSFIMTMRIFPETVERVINTKKNANAIFVSKYASFAIFNNRHIYDIHKYPYKSFIDSFPSVTSLEIVTPTLVNSQNSKVIVEWTNIYF